jgi:hypothetical protein
MPRGTKIDGEKRELLAINCGRLYAEGQDGVGGPPP